jgi:hypothetical protein
MVGPAAADGLGDPLPESLGDGLDSPDAWDAPAEGDEPAELLALLPVETHPTMTMIVMKLSGGAAIKKGVRRQNGSGP